MWLEVVISQSDYTRHDLLNFSGFKLYKFFGGELEYVAA